MDWLRVGRAIDSNSVPRQESSTTIRDGTVIAARTMNAMACTGSANALLSPLRLVSPLLLLLLGNDVAGDNAGDNAGDEGDVVLTASEHALVSLCAAIAEGNCSCASVCH